MTPPAMAMAMNARMVAVGPSRVPTEASSFHVAAARCADEMSGQHDRQTNQASGDRCTDADATESRAREPERRPAPRSSSSTFGTRRVRRSATAAVTVAATTTPQQVG